MARKKRDLDDRMSDVADLIASATELLKNLQNAESVEQEVDFDASLQEALEITKNLGPEIKHLLNGFED